MPRKEPGSDDAPEKAPRRARKSKREMPVDRKAWGYDPLVGLESIKTTMSGLLSELFARRAASDLPWEPPVDLYEEGRTLVVLVNLPGFRREDVQLHAYQSLLIIRGQSSETAVADASGYHLRERSLGAVHRALPLPFPIQAEGIKATLRDGVLRIALPLEGKRAVRSVEIEIE